MRLSVGTRLGPYEIVALIGAGGMGEVYRAKDTRLDRTVAIKVLPASLSAQPSSMQRFRREARAASALNHADEGRKLRWDPAVRFSRTDARRPRRWPVGSVLARIGAVRAGNRQSAISRRFPWKYAGLRRGCATEAAFQCSHGAAARVGCL